MKRHKTDSIYSGDTRYDQVAQLLENKKEYPLVKKFIDDVLEYNIAYFYNGNMKVSEFKAKKVYYIMGCRGTPEQMEEVMNSYHDILKQCLNEFFELDEQLWLPIYDVKDNRELNKIKLDQVDSFVSKLKLH